MAWSTDPISLDMSSVWICSRNDVAANLSVLLSAAGVWAFDREAARSAR